MANNKTSFDYILEGIGNLPGSMGRAIDDITNTAINAAALPFAAPQQITQFLGNAYNNGVGNAIVEEVEKPVNLVKGIVKDTWNFYTQPGAAQRMADDPVRPLTDAASILSLGGGTVAKLGKLTKAPALVSTGTRAMKAANIVDPFSLVLEATKFGARRAGGPQWLYKNTFEKLAGPSGNKLGEDAIQELVATANDSGYVRSSSGTEKVRGDVARLSDARGVETAKHTSDIPFQDLSGIKQNAITELGTKYAKGQDVIKHISSFDEKSDFLHGSQPGRVPGTQINIPGRNSYTTKIYPNDPNSPLQRRTNIKELHESLAIDNELNANYYDKAMGQNPNIGPFDTLGRVYINRGTRNYIDNAMGATPIDVPLGINIGERVPIPNAKPGMPSTMVKYPSKPPEKTSFIKSGEEISRRINLRDADYALASGSKGPSAHTAGIEMSFVKNPTSYGIGYILDKTLTNPRMSTKLAASINNKSRGPIAKGLRGGRRTLFELQDKQQPEMQQQQEEQIPDNPFSSGYVK